MLCTRASVLTKVENCRVMPVTPTATSAFSRVPVDGAK